MRGLATAAAALLLAFTCSTPARATEWHAHGLLDLVAAERGLAYQSNILTRGDTHFDAYSVRMFGDALVNPRLQVFTQVVLRDVSGLYVDGAYLNFTPDPNRDLHVLAGKIPWAIGTYAPRTYSNHNPLIGSPLMYQYHSSLDWYTVYPDADAVLAAAGTGAPFAGMPIINDSYWDVGVTLTGSRRPLEYAAGVTAGTPGWGSTGQDENSGKTVLGRIGLAPIPGIRFGVSGAYGPYLIQALAPLMPPGRQVTDFHQKIRMADLELQRGHVELRGEAAFNTWEHPNVGNLNATSYYGELKVALDFGAYLAGRWDALRFGEITDSTGERYPWDWNVTRLEVGGGYRFSREAVGKLVYQRDRTVMDEDAGLFNRASLVAAQLSLAF